MDTKWEIGPKSTTAPPDWIEIWERESGKKFNLYMPADAEDFGVDSLERLGEVGVDVVRRGGNEKLVLMLEPDRETTLTWLGGSGPLELRVRRKE